MYLGDTEAEQPVCQEMHLYNDLRGGGAGAGTNFKVLPLICMGIVLDPCRRGRRDMKGLVWSCLVAGLDGNEEVN